MEGCSRGDIFHVARVKSVKSAKEEETIPVRHRGDPFLRACRARTRSQVQQIQPAAGHHVWHSTRAARQLSIQTQTLRNFR